MTGILNSTLRLTILLAGTHKDGPYSELIVCNRLICFSGGVGVTGMFEFVAAYPNSKLYWSMKDCYASLPRHSQGVPDMAI
jgi:hypothetical protein